MLKGLASVKPLLVYRGRRDRRAFPRGPGSRRRRGGRPGELRLRQRSRPSTTTSAPAFQRRRLPQERAVLQKLSRGIRHRALHTLPEAAALIFGSLGGLKKDFAALPAAAPHPCSCSCASSRPALPEELALVPGVIPEPTPLTQDAGAGIRRRDDTAADAGRLHASANDGSTPRSSATRSLPDEAMASGTAWSGLDRGASRDELESPPGGMTLGLPDQTAGDDLRPGGQLSASAGNRPHTP